MSRNRRSRIQASQPTVDEVPCTRVTRSIAAAARSTHQQIQTRPSHPKNETPATNKPPAKKTSATSISSKPSSASRADQSNRKRNALSETRVDVDDKSINTDRGLWLANKTVEDLLTPFNCSICYVLCLPSIRQCVNGHLACKSCVARLKSGACPVCRDVAGVSVRNLVAERILLALDPVRSCPHEPQGCEAKLPVTALLAHEKVCDKSPPSCPLSECAFTGRYLEVREHFASTHSFIARCSASTMLRLDLERAGSDLFMREGQWAPRLLKHDGMSFLLQQIVVDGMLGTYAKAFGDREHAAKYRMRVRTGMPLRATFTLQIASLWEDESEILCGPSALRMSLEIAQLHAMEGILLLMVDIFQN